MRTLAVALLVAACGDPLLTVDGRGDPVFAVAGEVHDPTQLAADYEVAVVFLRFVRYDPDHPTQSELQTEVIPGEIAGTFPAAFRLALSRPPQVHSWGSESYGLIGGGSLPSVFAPGHAPDGVRIGQLAIGPRSELDRLPRKITFNLAEARTMGKLVGPHLPHTTITGYQVIYADGVARGDVIYPAPGQPISDGFTLVDARGFFGALVWQTCANDRYEASYALPGYQACIAANHALIDCIQGCRSTVGGVACEDACRVRFPGQVDSQRCLDSVAQLEQACGPPQRPSVDEVHVLADHAKLSVVLGTDDITDGLWFQHATEIE